MKKNIIITSVLLSFFLSGLAQSNSIPFTLEDRDRIIRTEQEIASLRTEINIRFESVDVKFESMDVKFESMQTQINDLKTMFVWGFGILISLTLFTLGYVIWDRRTALNPIQKTTVSLTQKVAILENILKEEAASNPRLAGILRSYGIF